MTQELAAWFTELKQPFDIPDFEPDIDDKDKAKHTELRYHSVVQVPVIF
jgi:hypothetical protein